MSFRQITIMGNVGKDPEIKKLESGAQIGLFSVAVGEKYKDRNGKDQEKTSWFNVTAWQQKEGGLVSSVISKYVRKGQQVFVQGVPEIEEYEKDGGKRYAFKIRLGGPGSTIRLLGSPKGSSENKTNGEAAQEQSPAGSQSYDPDDQIPF